MPTFPVPTRPQMVRYSDSTYHYYCLSAHGVALATENWRIIRVKLDGTGVAYPDTAGDEPVHAATDLATVQAYFA